MGRHASYEPYRLKSGGREMGNYRAWIPGQGAVDLGTENLSAASSLARDLRDGTNGQVASINNAMDSNNPPVVIDLDTGSYSPPIHETKDNDGPINQEKQRAFSVFQKWAIEKGPSQPEPAPIETPEKIGIPPATPSVARQITPAQTRKRGLTPEQSAKISGALKRVVVKINVLGGDALVRLMGRDACELDDDDLDLLALGWEMQLELWLESAKLKPVYIIVLANVLLVSAMYLGGTPIEKKPKLVSVPLTDSSQLPKPESQTRHTGLVPPDGPRGV